MRKDPEAEVKAVKDLIWEAIDAGLLQHRHRHLDPGRPDASRR